MSIRWGFVATLVVLVTASSLPAHSAPRPVVANWTGTLDLYGHYARPGLARTYLANVRVIAGLDGARLFEWTTRDSADTVGSVESTLLRGDSVFVSVNGGRWRLLDERRATQAWLQAVGFFTFRSGTEAGSNRLTETFRTNADPLRQERRITSSWAHPRFGDVDDLVACRFGADRGSPLPQTLEFHIHERDQDWTARLEYQGGGGPHTGLSLAAPDTFDLPGPDENALTGHLTWETIAPGLHLASMDDVHSRSLVVEFADSLAVLESAVSSANGERLIDAIHEKWPDKPIKWFLFSHHHPHYLGGIRAFIAEGATIAVAPKNRDYVAEIAARKFTREPDRLAAAPKALRMAGVDGRFRLAEGTNEMIAVNIAERSTHTDDFLIFWFPRQRVLFETEQGWFARDGKTVASRRAAMLLQVLDDEKLDVDRIAQSWPFESTDAVMTRSRLAELVAARGK
ncbi:MAG TPA: hypothetical protein VF720_03455 [Candidatus Eisenbacteria bacterium]